MKDLKLVEVNGEKLLDLEQAVEILDEAIGKLEELFPSVELTSYENIPEEEEIIGKEVIITACNNMFFVDFVGWIELDRRVDSEVYVWFNGIIVFPEFNMKIGGGINNDYRIVRMDYDYINKDWSKPYVDSL